MAPQSCAENRGLTPSLLTVVGCIQSLSRNALAALGVAAMFCSQVSAKPTVTLQPLKIPDGEVRFTVWMDYSGHPAENELLGREVVIGETADKRFRMYFDLSSGESRVNSHYQNQAFVCENMNGKPSCIPFTVFATPVGQFSDSMRDVDFIVEDEGKTHSGQWKLPVHSFSNAPVLAIAEAIPSPIPVNVGSETTVKIVFKDLLSDSRIRIDDHPVLLQEEKAMWKSAAVQALQQGKPILIGEGEIDHVFDVKLNPSILDALSASIAPVREDKPHTRLTLLVGHQVEYGGHQRQLEVELPVRFVPSFWSLFLVVLLGSALGIVFSFVLPGDKKTNVSWRTFVAAAAFSLIVEAVCILLVAGGSKLVIFKQEVNPSQLLTVLLIGFASGLIIVWRSDALRTWLDHLIQIGTPKTGND